MLPPDLLLNPLKLSLKICGGEDADSSSGPGDELDEPVPARDLHSPSLLRKTAAELLDVLVRRLSLLCKYDADPGAKCRLYGMTLQPVGIKDQDHILSAVGPIIGEALQKLFPRAVQILLCDLPR